MTSRYYAAMEFQIQWNAPDYSAAQFDSLRLHPWRAARGFLYPLLFVLAGLIMLAVGQWRGGATFFLIGVAFIALTLALARWRWGRKGKKLAGVPAIACTADSHGLVLRTANTVETHPWSDFSSMLDAPGFFRLDRAGKKALPVYLPKNLMNELQQERLASLLGASVAGGARQQA